MLKAIPGVEFPFTGGQRSLGLLSSVVKNGAHAKGRKSTASSLARSSPGSGPGPWRV